MNLEDKFNEIVKGHLETLTERFEQKLLDILEKGLPQETKVIMFEYDSPFFGDDFAVHMHFLDKNITSISSHDFLHDEVVVPDEIYGDEQYEEICPGGRASEVLASWLVERWSKHKTIPINAYAGHHDTSYLTLLNNGRTVKWEEMIKEGKG